jgi:LysM repeat protein
MTLNQDWKDTIEDGVKNDQWDRYDKTLLDEVATLNLRLASVPGFKSVDWKLAKAILWVESSGPLKFSAKAKKMIVNPAWNARVMQIGNTGDPAYTIVKNLKENTKLVVNPSLDLKGDINDPFINVKFALTYLMQRHVTGETRSIKSDTDKKTYTETVKNGDSFSAIAARVGTTIEVLQQMNPTKVTMIKKGDVLSYVKASLQKVASGWMVMTTETIAKRYNGGGDKNYKDKLDYVLAVFDRLERKK